MLSYLFWPNPGVTGYGNPKVIAILVVCIVCMIGSSILGRILRRHSNPVTRRITQSWPRALFWFGFLGFVLAVSRAEGVSYLSMRFLWVLLGIALVLYIFVQCKLFKARHYEVVPKVKTEDPRDKYLPKRK